MGVKVDRFRENQPMPKLFATDIYVSRYLGDLLDFSCPELQKR